MFAVKKCNRVPVSRTQAIVSIYIHYQTILHVQVSAKKTSANDLYLD
jgi:hypothetical protein